MKELANKFYANTPRNWGAIIPINQPIKMRYWECKRKSQLADQAKNDAQKKGFPRSP
jgi:hypothetical protein